MRHEKDESERCPQRKLSMAEFPQINKIEILYTFQRGDIVEGRELPDFRYGVGIVRARKYMAVGWIYLVRYWNCETESLTTRWMFQENLVKSESPWHPDNEMENPA